MAQQIPEGTEISVVIPVYGSESILEVLYARLKVAIETITPSFEIILVDDRGPGDAWGVIQALADRDYRVVGLRLSRNFGQHYAITAGIDFSRGNWLVVMDCDLQDRPEEIPRFWEKAHMGYDVVVGRRVERQDPWRKRFLSRIFHRFLGFMTDQKSDESQANFGIYSRKVVNELTRMPEASRVLPLLVKWLGFESATIDIQHDERAEGSSSYNFAKLMSLATDAIVSYSNKPLKIFVQLGFAISFFSFLFGIWLIARYLIFGHVVPGWTSVMVSLYFTSGLILFGMGILGVYIGRIFNQVKGRPKYVVDLITKGNSFSKGNYRDG